MILTIILFICILGLLVFVHELGHFAMARRMGIAVEEFGFGFPPRLIGFQRLTRKKIVKVAEREETEVAVTDYSLGGAEVIKETIQEKTEEIDEVMLIKKWRVVRGTRQPEKKKLKTGTIYSLNWIPVGGFVKIKGEQGDSSRDQDSFAHKKVWQRTLVLSAGVLMNFLLAAVLLSLGFTLGLPSIIDEHLPPQAVVRERAIQIVDTQEGSPARQAGLQMGDFITAVDGQPYVRIVDFQTYTKPRAGQKITVSIKRGQEAKTVTVIPEDLGKQGEGLIGVWLAETGTVRYPWYYAVWMGAKTTVSLTGQILAALYELIKNLLISQRVSADIAGPVGIAVLTGQVAKLGFIYILQFTALLSINLAIINFFPFPALDGGRVLFLIIEKIRGKPVKQKIEAAIHNIGFLILIGLIIIVTFRDVARFGDSIKGFFSNLFG